MIHRTAFSKNFGFRVPELRRKEYDNQIQNERRQDELEHFLRVRRGILLQQRLSQKLREEEVARREAANGPDVYNALALRSVR